MTTDFQNLLAWRKAAGMTRQELADATGYGISTIVDMETGRYRSSGKPVDAKALQRYKLACAAVAAGVSAPWFVQAIEAQQYQPQMIIIQQLTADDD